MGKVVVYVESADWLGHAQTQREYYVKMMLDQEWKVIVLTRAADTTVLWARSLDPSQQERLYVHALPAGPASVFEKWLKWRWVNNQVRQAEKQSGWTVDTVFLSWFDGMQRSLRTAFLTRFVFRYSWVGLYFVPAHFRPDVKMKGSRKLVKTLADAAIMRFGRCRGIGVLDEGLRFGWARRENEVPVVFFPEITETEIIRTAEIESIRERADGRCIFGLLGDLSPRKGVLGFLRMARDMDPAKGFFVLAGNFNINRFPVQERDELCRLLQTAGRDNCHFRLEHIDSAQEFNALVDSCDVLYLFYKNYYSTSGLLAKAALFRKPVIVARGYCMGERVEKYNLGVTVAGDSYPKLLEAANRLAEPAYREEILKGGGFAGYNSQNSPAALQRALRQLLDHG